MHTFLFQNFFEGSLDLDSTQEGSSPALMSSMNIEDNEAVSDLKDLSVFVDDPEKHVGGYVSYNVSTKVCCL